MRLYIDPGTGSMLFTLLIGLAGGLIYLGRTLFMKLKFLARGGRTPTAGSDRIPLVIFADDRRYWPVFAPVCRALARRGQTVTYLTASPDDAALTADLPGLTAEFIGTGARAFARMNLLSADVVVSTTPSLDVFQWKRSRHVSTYIHLPHACSDLTIYRMFGLDYYDEILISGMYQMTQIRALESLRALPPKRITPVGIPYMDQLAARVRTEAAPPAPSDRPTLLLAPSWGPNGILSRYGARIIERLLETGADLIIRPHPQSWVQEPELLADLRARYPASDRLTWNRDSDNYAVLRRADLLISDFSGVLFDFTLVFDKPIIYADTSFDKSPYDCWWLEDPLWTFEILPHLGPQLMAADLETPEAMHALIRRTLTHDTYAAGRTKARRETWLHPGEGADRAAERIIAAVAEARARSSAADPAEVPA